MSRRPHSPPPKDYYAQLGVDPHATLDEIRAAYRQRAFECHPDVNRGVDQAAANADMARLNEAYFVLANFSRRITYDRQRRDWAAREAAWRVYQSRSRDNQFESKDAPQPPPYPDGRKRPRYRDAAWYAYRYGVSSEDIQLPRWLEALYDWQSALFQRLRSYMWMISFWIPVIVFSLLLILGFVGFQLVAQDPLIIYLGIESIDVLIAISIFFLAFWVFLLIRPRRW